MISFSPYQQKILYETLVTIINDSRSGLLIFRDKKRHFQGLRDTHSVSGTVPDYQGQLACTGWSEHSEYNGWFCIIRTDLGCKVS